MTDSTHRVTNRETPAHAPLRRMGEVPVLARVAWDAGNQRWYAATAVRWTPTHVMVTWREDHWAPHEERFEWLRSEDVVRTATWADDEPIGFVAARWTVGQLRAELVGLPDDLPVLVLVDESAAVL